jgi:hypothetical protein
MPANAYIWTIAIDPVTPTTLYTATAGGIYKSGDSAATWVAVNSAPNARAVAIDPLSPSTLYAGTLGFGTFKSTDGGATWVVLGGLANVDVAVLAIDPSAPSTVFAGTWQGVFKSTDGGATWNAANNGLPLGRVEALAIHPWSPAVVYAGLPGSLASQSGVFKSSDGGATWEDFSEGLPNRWATSLALDPNGRTTLYAGLTYDGVWQRRGTSGDFFALAPCRAIDTRSADGPAVDAGRARIFTMTDRCGVPRDADAVSFNLTATGATSAGHLQVYPANTLLRPPASSLNFSAGQTRASNAVTVLGTGGDLSVFSGQGTGSVHVILDLNGYFK